MISLEKLGDGYRLLRLLYDKVLIPPSVLAELIHGQFVDEHAYAEHYGISDFLQVVEVQSKHGLLLAKRLERPIQKTVAAPEFGERFRAVLSSKSRQIGLRNGA